MGKRNSTATNDIRYLRYAQMGMELIFCHNSTISYPKHNHVSVLTMGIVLDGQVILTTNQEIKVCRQNETFAILPYVPHSIMAQDSYTLLSLCIDKSVVNNYDIQTIQDTIAMLLTQALNTELITPHQLSQLLNRLDEIIDFSDSHKKEYNPYIQDLKTQLELHPEQKLTIDEMAQNAFLSKYHFIRNFKSEVGLTPHQFQIQNRIRKAQRLICET